MTKQNLAVFTVLYQCVFSILAMYSTTYPSFLAHLGIGWPLIKFLIYLLVHRVVVYVQCVTLKFLLIVIIDLSSSGVGYGPQIP